MNVPFMDLSRIHTPLRADFEAAMGRVAREGSFILGEDVASFEKEFAAYHGAREAVGTSNGLDALAMTLRALDIGPGDEVITVANSFIATALAISQVGAKPVLVDCDPDTLAMTVEGVELALTSRTRAIIVVHLYGRIACGDELVELARQRSIVLLEDADKAHGAILNGAKAGTIGRAGCFSFYPAKNLGAFGDAGAMITDDPDLAARVRAMRNYGGVRKYVHDEFGGNARLDTLQAAILRIKLPHLDEWNSARRNIANIYYERFGDMETKQGLVVPAKPRLAGDGRDHVHHLFIIEVTHREDVMARLASRGIGCAIHYPTPIHLQPCYASLGCGPGSFPVAEQTSGVLLSLPMFPGMTSEEVHYVADEVIGIIEEVRS